MGYSFSQRVPGVYGTKKIERGGPLVTGGGYSGGGSLSCCLFFVSDISPGSSI
jgi:hypothetical protein